MFIINFNSLSPKNKKATTGLEPVIRVLQTLALPTWPRRHKQLG